MPKNRNRCPKIAIFEMRYIFQTVMLGIYVKLRPCTGHGPAASVPVVSESVFALKMIYGIFRYKSNLNR